MPANKNGLSNCYSGFQLWITK